MEIWVKIGQLIVTLFLGIGAFYIGYQNAQSNKVRVKIELFQKRYDWVSRLREVVKGDYKLTYSVLEEKSFIDIQNLFQKQFDSLMELSAESRMLFKHIIEQKQKFAPLDDAFFRSGDEMKNAYQDYLEIHTEYCIDVVNYLFTLTECMKAISSKIEERYTNEVGHITSIAENLTKKRKDDGASIYWSARLIELTQLPSMCFADFLNLITQETSIANQPKQKKLRKYFGFKG